MFLAETYSGSTVALIAGAAASIPALIGQALRYLNRRADIEAGGQQVTAETVRNLFQELRDLRAKLDETNKKVDALSREAQRRSRIIYGLKAITRRLRVRLDMSEAEIDRAEQQDDIDLGIGADLPDPTAAAAPGDGI